MMFLPVVVLMMLWTVIGLITQSKEDTPPPGEEPGASASAKAGKDAFFEVTRFIMTDEEIEIYKHLSSEEDRDEFIEEFWKKRDPSPETEENENKEEFEERITYANKWFKEHSKGRGWDTERGRMLLQLGFPDRREWGEAEDIVRGGKPRNIGAMITSKPIPMEIWTYYEYRLVLVFADPYEKGRLELTEVPTELPAALKKAKFALDLRNQKNLRHAFRFDVQYKDNGLEVTIPVKKVSFEEKDGEMKAEFDIVVYIYKDNKKTDEIHTQQIFGMEKEKLLTRKKINFTIPYTPREKGKYYFDVVIEEKGSESKFRDFADFKL